MKYFKNTNGDVFAYDQDQIDHGLVKDSLVEMTAKEIEAHLNPPRSIDAVHTAKLSEINTAYIHEVSAILEKYPEAETLTWDKQEEEARAWTADNTAATPLLDAISQGRAMDKAELVSRVIAKADAWIAASGLATGKRQALEDEISAALAANDRAAIESVEW